MIIFPESAFALYLNRKPNMLYSLKELSRDITIVVGSLRYDRKAIYNSTYIFQKANLFIADKVVLVPFGERVPLPKFMTDIINDIFFDGAVDYAVADSFKDIVIDGVKFEVRYVMKLLRTVHIVRIQNI